MKKKHRLIFFGSPEFALPPLKTLYLGGYEIVGVYTQDSLSTEWVKVDERIFGRSTFLSFSS